MRKTILALSLIFGLSRCAQKSVPVAENNIAPEAVPAVSMTDTLPEPPVEKAAEKTAKKNIQRKAVVKPIKAVTPVTTPVAPAASAEKKSEPVSVQSQEAPATDPAAAVAPVPQEANPFIGGFLMDHWLSLMGLMATFGGAWGIWGFYRRRKE